MIASATVVAIGDAVVMAMAMVMMIVIIVVIVVVVCHLEVRFAPLYRFNARQKRPAAVGAAAIVVASSDGGSSRSNSSSGANGIFVMVVGVVDVVALDAVSG